jgi:hypothetical protein
MSKRRNVYLEILGPKMLSKINISKDHKRIGLALGLLTTSAVILVACGSGGDSSSSSSS